MLSGGGRCNFTNLHTAPDGFLSANPSFCISALSRYTQWDFIELVRKHGIRYHEKTHGQLFCDNSSREILAMLLSECEAAGVHIITGCETHCVEAGGGFQLAASAGEFRAASLVIASGGLSIPKMGGSGFGYDVARQFGMNIIPVRPALVPFVVTGGPGEFMAQLAGVSVPARMSTNGQAFVDDMLFTHRGLSGPAALQLSSYWMEGEDLTIDLLPQLTVHDHLLHMKRQQPRLLLRTVLTEHLPRALVQSLESNWWPEYADRPLAAWPDRLLLEIAEKLTHWTITPAGTEGYRTAEVTRGGVDTRELLSKNMESRNCTGLYFIGEVVDVTGWLGGYNFQWAWSSGHAAGQTV